jgi:hypothetical protein
LFSFRYPLLATPSPPCVPVRSGPKGVGIHCVVVAPRSRACARSTASILQTG